MRPPSSRVVTQWISALCLFATLVTLGGLAPAQTAAGSKRKLSQQSLSKSPDRGGLSLAPEIPPPVTTDTWKGGASGDWSVAGNWNNGAITSGENILINLTTAATDEDNSPTIGTLTLSNVGDTVTLLNGTTLTVDGNITNNGTITINSGGSNTFLSVGASLTLSGTGSVVLGTGGPNYIVGASGATLTNASNITGVGNIGNGALILANTGTINANVSGDTLELDPGGFDQYEDNGSDQWRRAGAQRLQLDEHGRNDFSGDGIDGSAGRHDHYGGNADHERNGSDRWRRFHAGGADQCGNVRDSQRSDGDDFGNHRQHRDDADQLRGQ